MRSIVFLGQGLGLLSVDDMGRFGFFSLLREFHQAHLNVTILDIILLYFILKQDLTAENPLYESRSLFLRWLLLSCS